MNKQKAIQVGGIPVDLYKEEEYELLLSSAISNGEKKTFFNTNAHLVVLANTKYQWLKEAFRSQVDYVMCDGSGIQLGCYILGKKIPDKIAYNVWFWEFAKFCAKNDYRIFFLGAKQEVVEKAAKNMRSHAPGLQIDSHHGYFDHKNDGPENDEVKRKINSFAPQVLLVGLGMPIQEAWILKNMKDLNANAFFPCGGAFDFFAKIKPLAPYWIRAIKMEWLFRMVLEPIRLGKRYLLENPQFIYYVLKNR